MLSCVVTVSLQAVYTALKETESRATDVVPLWKVPVLAPLIPRQRKALQAVSLIRQTTEELIAKCKEMVDAEEQVRAATMVVLTQVCICICGHAVCFCTITQAPCTGADIHLLR